ncbi:leucyl/phenylalanyl-tRNA--protein transferase [Endozoicomonas sp. (ex Bugula neritina AB1)]|nr:leucyl/phenylalanyl-tRNA--protein transferase [Endozoicomonas sp. (ex Bugula neritina AB1)]
MKQTITLLDDTHVVFPPVHQALYQPDGLLALGGNLEINTLLSAYRQGIFPWFSDDDPILWWSPAPRMVFEPGQLHRSRSLSKLIRKNPYNITFDHDFQGVIRACAEPRNNSEGTWITADMQTAYINLHQAGHAHSVEVWDDDQLVGGIYGVAIGRIFFGESMFSRKSNTSKLAITALSEQLKVWQFALVDCQVHNPHLKSLGAKPISREEFLKTLDHYCSLPPSGAHWKQDWQWIDHSL